MQMASADIPCTTKGCLLLLCGLPGSGKTTLSKDICVQLKEKHRSCGNRCLFVPVCYDAILTQGLEHRLIEAEKSHFSDAHTSIQQAPSEWRNHRVSIVGCVDRLMGGLLSGQACNFGKPEQIEEEIWTNFRSQVTMVALETHLEHVVIIIDDNMYYSSMRYQYYQLARKYHFGFCQIHLSCDVQESVKRNAQRLGSVQTQVITTMAERFEAPDPQRNRWEQNSLTLVNCDKMGGVMALIDRTLEYPVETVEEDVESQEESRVICSQSVLYQLDQILRKIVTQRIEEVRGTLTKDDLKQFAKRMNTIKAALYTELKTGSILMPVRLTQNITDASKDKAGPIYTLMDNYFHSLMDGKKIKDNISWKT